METLIDFILLIILNYFVLMVYYVLLAVNETDTMVWDNVLEQTCLYRVKEHNSAYDHIFGEGKGWIYCSNEVSLREAKNIRWFKIWQGCTCKLTIERTKIDLSLWK